MGSILIKMSNNNYYGAVGTNPLSPIPKSPEKLLADLLKDNYDETITGIPFSDIEGQYGKWFSGMGDIAIFFQDTGHINVSGSVDHNIQDFDHYTDIHLFARSRNADYDDGSGEKMLYDLETWIIKTIVQHNEDLTDKGIQWIEYEDSRDMPYFMGDETNYDNLVNRRIISVFMKIRMINQAS